MDGLNPIIISCFDLKHNMEVLRILPEGADVPHGVEIVPDDEISQVTANLGIGEISAREVKPKMIEALQKFIDHNGLAIRAAGEAILKCENGNDVLYIAARTATKH